MKKFLQYPLSIGMVLLLILSCSSGTQDEGGAEVILDDNERMAWWREAKFGLFIHWGVYAVPAGKYGEKYDYGEWIMHHARIPAAEYKKYASQFNPINYDPAAWVKVARDAGMRYIVITSKHHDGFALEKIAMKRWKGHRHAVR